MPVSSSLLPVSEGTLRRADQNCAGKPERFFRTHPFPIKPVLPHILLSHWCLLFDPDSLRWASIRVGKQNIRNGAS